MGTKLIYYANMLIGFYLMEKFALNELILVLVILVGQFERDSFFSDNRVSWMTKLIRSTITFKLFVIIDVVIDDFARNVSKKLV